MNFNCCVTLLCVLVFVNRAELANNGYIHDCLLYWGPGYNDILTFLCQDHHQVNNYFVPGATRECSNETTTFQTGNGIATIHFRDCQISQLSGDIFPSYPALRTLNMSSMELNHLPSAFFGGAIKLETFLASHNQLQVLRVDQFALASKLTAVDLSFNNISTIETGTFDDRSSSLVSIDLSHNQIHLIPFETFHKLVNLKMLNLSHNRMESIEIGTFSNQRNLNTLDLSFNAFTVIDLGVVLPHIGAIARFFVEGNPLADNISGYKQQLFPHLIWTDKFAAALPTSHRTDDNAVDNSRDQSSSNDSQGERNGNRNPFDSTISVDLSNSPIIWIILVGIALTIAMLAALFIRLKRFERIYWAEWTNGKNNEYHGEKNMCSVAYDNQCDKILIE